MVRTSTRARRAVAAVEFAAVLPAIMILLVGIVEVGRLIEFQQVLSNATREGGRQAATGQMTNAQVQQVVIQYVQAAGFNTTGMTVTVTDLTSGVEVSQANYLDRLQVSSTYPYSNVSWSALGLIMPNSFTISAQVQWMTVVDKPFPIFPDPPVG